MARAYAPKQTYHHKRQTHVTAVAGPPHKSVTKQDGAKRVYVIHGTKVFATDTFDRFWFFVSERKIIYDKRLNGDSGPWTEDEALRQFSFCNTFRLTDATCQYLIQWVIKVGAQTPAELVFRVVLFDTFTRISTWEYLLKKVGAPLWSTYNRGVYLRALEAAKDDGISLYTGSFQKPAPKLGYDESYANHLVALELLMEDDLPGRLVKAKRMSDIYNWLRTFKGMGEFNTWQLIMNLSYTGLLAKCSDLDSFVALGCGAKAGLKRCFGSTLEPAMQLAVVRWMQETQADHFKRLCLVPATLGPDHHEMQVCDIEHALCEIDKYERIRTRPTKPKKGFNPSQTHASDFALPVNFGGHEDEEEEERWVVSSIGGKRKQDGVLQYKVFWEGYAKPTWEPASTIKEDAPEAVKLFLDSLS